MQKKMIYNSFEFKSITCSFESFSDIPNKTLNQHLQKPTTPIRLANINSISVNNSETPIICENIKNSQVNFIVPGIPQYKIHIRKIQIPKFGARCITPDTSSVDLELNRLCTQSTKKNIKADKNECVMVKKIALMQPVESPQHNIMYIIFIS